MSTLLELAEFCGYTQGDNPEPTTGAPGEGGTWNPLTILLPQNIAQAAAQAGFVADCWQNSVTGEIVIACRGTVASAPSSFWSDAQLASGVPPSVLTYAQIFARTVARDFPNATITETGHSLGGYLAQAGLEAIVNSPLFQGSASAVTFDAPGLPSSEITGSASAYDCLNLYAQGDWVNLSGGTHLGSITDYASLPVGPSLTQEFADYQNWFNKASPGWGSWGGEAAGTVAIENDLLSAHGITQITQYLSANPSVGNDTPTEFELTGQGTPPSTLLALNPGLGLSFTLSDGNGNSIKYTVATPFLQSLITALAPSSSLLDGESYSALSAELAVEPSGSYPIQQLQTLPSSLLSSTHVYGAATQSSLALSASPFGEATGLAGQLLLSSSAPDDQFVYNIPTPGTTYSETIDSGSGQGSVWLGAQSFAQLVGGNPLSGTPFTWQDSNGDQYVFTSSPSSSIGTLTISQGLFGGNSGNSITLQNFNLSAAQSSPTGFFGIALPETAAITAVGATFPAGSLQAYTFSVDAPITVAQAITITLSGANSSDFEAVVGNQAVALTSNGSFTVTLAAGETRISFGLQDVTADNGTSDIANGATLQLTASMPNVVSPSGPPIQSTPLSISYLPGAPDASFAPQPTSTINGTVNGGVTTYQGDGLDDSIVAGAGPNAILASNSGSDIIVGGSGSNTVYGGSGNDQITLNGSQDWVSLGNGFNTVSGSSGGGDTIYGQGGDAIVSGNGGKDQIFLGNGTNQIYAGAQTTLPNAIIQGLSGTASGLQGDVLAALDGTNTIVGGTGNDLITVGTGNDVVVLGPGNNLFVGGWDSTKVTGSWSFTTSGTTFQISNVANFLESYTNPYAQPYNGVTELPGSTASGPLGAGNDTVFAGKGNDFIALPNGNNYVDMGTGNSTVGAGMGNNTIVAGSGADLILGGGGTTYISGGSGADTIYGGDGNNTIIGGSGNSTIYSAAYFPLSGGFQTTFLNGNLDQNYVTGGSGNDLIFGSGGSDTLIGGTGNATIYGGSGNENIVGGAGTDVLSGGSGNDTISAGGSGNDSLFANGTSSSMTLEYGGSGSDWIQGGSGINTIYAGDGGTAAKPTDVLASTDSTSNTTIYGGSGIDFLQGGAGSNVIYAGDGGTASAPTTVLAAAGDTTVYGGLGTDYIQGYSGIEVLYAGDGGTQTAPTTIVAGTGTAMLNGGAGPAVLQDLQSGQDLLVAGTSDDTLVGTGNDTLVAGPGNDLLQTNGGSVTFDVAATSGQDTIHTVGGTENVDLGTTLGPTSMAGGVSFDAQGNSYLVLTAPTGSSVSIEDAFTGSLGTVTFADSGAVSEPTLLSHVFGGDSIAAFGSNDLIVGIQNNESLQAGTYFDTISSWGNNSTINAGSSYHGDVIYSTGASASITSGTGADIITATGNNDTLKGGTYGDYITVSGANSKVTGSTGADSLTASGSNDTLIGGSGNTVFYVNNASTVVQDFNSSAVDTIVSTVSFALPFDYNNMLVLSGTANIVGTGNANADTLIAGAGLDTLVAGNNPNTLVGGTGNTTFVVNSTSDVVQNSYTTTSDTIRSSVNFTLPANVNTLVLTGSAALTGTANGGNDTLVSNSGADTLYAGTGNDTFILNSASVVVQGTTSASSTVDAGFSYTLPTNINGLVLTGTGNLTGTANSGNDTLVSNSGLDTLVGGSGADIFVVNNAADVLTNLNASDTVQTSLNYTMPVGVANLLLTGSGSVTATGNASSDVITANAGNDTLTAGSGVATLFGGAGSDSFVVNSSSDVVQQSHAGTGSVIQSSATFTLPTNVNSILLTGSTNIAATGNAANDSMVGNAGNDTLTAGAGTDTLVAGSGLVTLSGGAGNDLFLVNNTGDVVQSSSTTASDTIQSSASFTLPTNVNTLVLTGTTNLSATTNSGNDVVTGNAGSDTLTATAGTDTLIAGGGVDTLVGGTGNDSFIVNNTLDVVSVGGTHGADTVQASTNYTLPANVTTLILTGSAGLNGTANGTGADSVIGNAGNDTLTAGGGRDTLQAGSGPATLVGGSGGTVFVVDSTSDMIQNISAGVSNELVTSVNATLPTNIDTLALSGNGNLIGTGNSDSSNVLIASSGNDTLVAGSAVSTLEGGVGQNTFVVNSAADSIQAVASATNTVLSSVSYTLPTYVTTLELTGSANLTATGNMLADSIVGNAGNDTLTAGVGNDTLVAGSGLATLVGGVGNDTFIINNTGDVIQGQMAGEHNTLVSLVTVTLPTNINTLLLIGSGNLTGTANSASDSIGGNSGSDTLVAGAGNDTLAGGAGVDTFIGGTGSATFLVNNTADTIQNASSTSANSVLTSVSYTLPTNVNALTLVGPANIAGTGNAANDTLTSGEGNDTLYAGGGVDTLIGGTGNTTFVVNATGDVVQDSSSITSNTIQTSVSYTLPTDVNSLVLTGTAALTGTANSGNDTLASNAGVDTLMGGSGNDTFIVNNANDVVQDTSTTASNSVQTALTYALPVDVNSLVLTGTAAVTGTANSGNDTLTSNTGADTLVGGAGNDTFVVNNASDVVQDTATTASNTIDSSVSYTLPTNINTLTLTGSSSLTATGNAANDVITANAGSDTLIAGTGTDTLIGGAGGDMFVVNNTSDVVQDTTVGANNAVSSSVSFALPTNVNSLLLTGTGNLVGTANGGNDTLTSNSGIDTLVGGSGTDVFIVNNPADVIQTALAGDTVESSFSYTLPSNASGLILTGTGNISGTGNANTDTLVAGAGSDTLTAGTGAATMVGGTGNTTFVVNSGGDVVQDTIAGTTNTIQSSVSYTLPANVDSLTLTGAGNLTGTGNGDTANVLTGNSGNDVLNGTATFTTINGGSGTDTLNAGPYFNVIYAGSGGTVGAPTYVHGDAVGTSFNTQSTIYGGSGSGTDFLFGGPGTDVIYAGGGLDTSVSGGAGFDTIYGGSGNGDQLFANADAVVYAGSGGTTSNHADIYTNPTGAGADTIYGGSGYALATDQNSGSGGNSIFYGGTGTLIAYAYGADTFVAGTGTGEFQDATLGNLAATPTVVLNSGFGNTDVFVAGQGSFATLSFGSGLTPGAMTVSGGYDSSTTALGLAISGTSGTLLVDEGLDPGLPGTFYLPNNPAALGTISFAGSGNLTLAQLIAQAHSVDATVNGGSLIFSAQNGESVTGSNSVPDTISAWGANDTLTAGSTATAIWSEGTSALVYAGSGSDTLQGLGTGDTLYGAASATATLFVVTNTSDVVAQTSSNGGVDTIDSSVSYTLPANVDTLELGGSVAIVGTGNSDTNNLISGNSGNDTLVAGSANTTIEAGFGGGNQVLQGGAGTDYLDASNSSGNDTLISGSGVTTLNGGGAVYGGGSQETYVINNASDVVTSTKVFNGNDTLEASVSYTVSNNYVHTLIGTGSGNLSLQVISIGAPGHDSIVANSGNDTLYPAGTNNTLVGGTGNDVFVIADSSDVVTNGSTNDTVQADANYTLPGGITHMVVPIEFATVTGNSLNDVIADTGGNGQNTLVAGSGSDTLEAGSGNTGADMLVSSTTTATTMDGGSSPVVFVINNASDVLLNAIASDTIQSSINYTLPSSVNTLILIGSGNLTGTGNSNADSIVANTGNDTLVSGSAKDTLVAGTTSSSNDVLVVNNATDVLTIGATHGNDTINSSVTYTLPTKVNVLVLTGTAALKGTANSNTDTLVSNTGVDTLVGSTGNDTFVVNNASDIVTDTSTTASNTLQASVTYTLPTHVNSLVFTGTAALKGTANSGNDTLTSNTGVDTLVGGTVSGANDLFVVNNASDVVTVGSTHGTDTIQSSVSYTTSSNVANLTLIGTANLSGTGNSLSDVLTANAGNDTLTAGTGVATMNGGSGNDIFVVNNASDVVQNAYTTSSDTIKSSVTYTLPTNVNSLTLTGTAALKGTANNGTDTLTSNTGVDTLVGGSGNDTFVVNNASDVVQDTSSTASNTIQASVTYTLPTDVNSLVLTGTAALKGTANSGNDTLTSNTGVDTLVGNTGNDTFVLNNASDVVQDTSTTASNTIQAPFNYTLPTDINSLVLTGASALTGTANSANDTLTSNTGVDTLVGGGLSSSNDLFVVSNASDVITVGSTHGTDSVQSSVSYTAPANVADLILTGTGNLSGTGNSLSNLLTANAGNDTLTAGSGVATMNGGSGNDVFVVNNASDVVQNTYSTASDTIQSSVTYTLPTNVNSLLLTGTAAVKGTANNGTDTLSSNSGVDTLVGGTGNDTFVVNNASDAVQDTSTTASNTIQASVTYTLPTDVNNLVLTGTGALTGTGNSGNDLLTANSGADTLVAGAGADTLVSGSGVDSLVGGAGTDLFEVNNTSDVVNVSAAGNDSIQSSVSYTLPTNVQYLMLTGTSALTGTGGSQTSLVVGNSGNDTLNGGSGIAVLEGGRTAGQDVLQASGNQAALIGGAGSATLTGGTYKDFFAAGSVGDIITAGATSNVVSVNKGDGAVTLTPTSGSTNVLSLGGGIDTESLILNKSGNNLVLNDGVNGDSITLTNWYSGSADQDYTTLQVVEIASPNYNPNGTDPRRNQAVEEFNFTSLVNLFNEAGCPSNWGLSLSLLPAQLPSGASAAYGGDLAYYFGLNGNLTGMNLSAAQNTLTNSFYATAPQTIDSWSSISGGGLQLLLRKPPTAIATPAAPVTSQIDPAVAGAVNGQSAVTRSHDPRPRLGGVMTRGDSPELPIRRPRGGVAERPAVPGSMHVDPSPPLASAMSVSGRSTYGQWLRMHQVLDAEAVTANHARGAEFEEPMTPVDLAVAALAVGPQRKPEARRWHDER
jgi:Ca2+-binding RTX toxin-like protein